MQVNMQVSYLYFVYFVGLSVYHLFCLFVYICLFYLNLSIYLLSQNILNDFFAVARRSVCPGSGVDQAELLPQRHHLRSLHHPTSSQEQGNYIIHTLYIIHYTLYIIHYTLYIIHYTLIDISTPPNVRIYET